MVRVCRRYVARVVCDVGYLPGRMHRRSYTGHRCLAATDRTEELPELLAKHSVVDPCHCHCRSQTSLMRVRGSDVMLRAARRCV